jgi:hypothetical protein
MRRTTGLIWVCAMGTVLVGACVTVKDTSDGGTPGASAGASGASGAPGSTGHPDAATATAGSGGSTGSSSTGPGANGTPRPGEFGSGGPTVDANCGLSSYGLDKIPADLLIVLDRSGSMNDPVVGTLDTRWTAMTAAIGEVVAMTQTSIRWGLKYFPDMAMACGVNDGAAIPIGDASGPAIATAIVDPVITPTGGRTPTRVGMNSATAYLKTLTDPNPKFILLATDGIPNCVPGEMDTATPDIAGAIQSVKDAAAAGFPTFVIGIATAGTDADTTLNDMAVGGGQPRAAGPPSYYPVANKADLVAALGKIGGQIGSCSFGLSMVPPDPTNVAVEADGNRVPQDPTHTNGWDYGTGMRSIQLFGTYCDQAKAALIKNVRAIFGCPGIVIP